MLNISFLEIYDERISNLKQKANRLREKKSNRASKSQETILHGSANRSFHKRCLKKNRERISRTQYCQLMEQIILKRTTLIRWGDSNRIKLISTKSGYFNLAYWKMKWFPSTSSVTFKYLIPHDERNEWIQFMKIWYLRVWMKVTGMMESYLTLTWC